jgi:peptidoglycan/xylan/chitin deacetylase (PgdA/CDA1 family)
MESGQSSRRSLARKAVRRRRRVGLGFATVAAGLVIVVVLIASCASPEDSTSTTGLPGTTTSAAPATSSTLTATTTTTTEAVTTSTSLATTTTAQLSTTTVAAQTAAPIVRHGSADHKWIALTFDDNYQGEKASQTLAVLRQYKVPATLFVIGHYVDLGPELAREIAAGGFEVGDHTRSHANCTTLSKRGLRIEIGNGTDHYRKLTGAPTVALFRPPGGFIDQKTCEVAAEKGFKYVVMWDVDTNDWRGRTADQITETVMGNAHNGAIVLMHMAGKHTAEALPTIIKRLRAVGYELVTLSKMLGL